MATSVRKQSLLAQIESERAARGTYSENDKVNQADENKSELKKVKAGNYDYLYYLALGLVIATLIIVILTAIALQHGL